MPYPSLRIDVHGPPRPMPRSRKGKFARRDTSADAWQRSIRNATLDVLLALADLGQPEPWLAAQAGVEGVYGRSPVRVDALFRMPKAQGKTELHLSVLPAKKPDRDNFDKAMLDALGNWRKQGSLLWRDDCQVCDGRIAKVYASKEKPPGVTVFVSPADLSAIEKFFD